MVFASLFFAQASGGVAVDPISGGAGWLGAGLLGAVLAWIFFVRLPANDKQTKELLDLHSRERETDRTSRHNLASVFQEALNKQILASELRNDKVTEAIQNQTTELRLELRNAFGTACKWWGDMAAAKKKDANGG
jgi:hypothetical protein